MRKIFLVIIVFLLVVLVGYSYLNGKENNKLSNIKVPEIIFPVPTPIPFYELTIPYLRERQYQSSLGELEKVSENGNYTSYLADYNSDGLKLFGMLTQPKGEMPPGGWPAIVFIHGYINPDSYRTLVNYNSYVDYFAKNGFVVFKIDLRGHDKSEGEPGGAYYSSDYIIDTLNASSALSSSDFVNSERIGLWGHSMAGNVVFRSFVAKGDIPAVVVWAGAGYTYSDLAAYRIQDLSYRPPPQDTERTRKRQLLRETYGDFNPDSAFWKQVVPTNYLSGVSGAIQVHHATDDPVVSIDYSRNLMEVLNSSQISHELFEYSSGGHNLTGSSFSQAMEASVEFFRNNL